MIPAATYSTPGKSSSPKKDSFASLTANFPALDSLWRVRYLATTSSAAFSCVLSIYEDGQQLAFILGCRGMHCGMLGWSCD